MQNNRGIIEFEDLFKEEIQERQQRNNPERRKMYRTAFVTYLFFMFVIMSVLYVATSSISGFTEVKTAEARMIDKITYDLQGMAVIETSHLSSFVETYDDYIGHVMIDDVHVLIYNLDNPDIEKHFLTEDQTMVDPVILDRILKGEITHFPDLDYPIVFYRDLDAEFRFDATIDFVTYENTVAVSTPFGTSLLSFVVYLTMLPILWVILKTDLMEDWLEIKLIKSKWFAIVAVGYLYLIAGNLISNVLSTLLSDLFAIGISTSYNQIAVIESLRSNGAVFMIISAIIMGPIVEELIFRKSLFGLISNEKIALVFSSVLFGGIHLLGEDSILHAIVNGSAYVILGLVFGIIYIKNDKNIWAPIAVHILSNTIAILGILFLL